MDAALRELVRSRAGSRCEYCHLPEQFSELQFHIEHIIPRQHGGTDGPENLALACPDCNLVKGPNLTGVEPGTHRVVRLFHPRQDKWTEHFSLDGALVVGRTPVGRVTVGLLRMNGAHRLRVRALLSGL
jgi:5-methylcytosine-specific restriction endonuclease McrA